MKKTIYTTIIVVLVLIFVIFCCVSCNREETHEPSEPDSSQTVTPGETPVESVKTPVENRICEAVPGQEHQGDYGVVKAGAVSEMIDDIKKEGITVQDIQTVYSDLEMAQALNIRGYGNILNLSIALRSLYVINERFPFEYINQIDEKTIYGVYKTIDSENELCFMYLFFRKLDAQREGIQEDTESWWLDGKVFFIKNTLQYSDFSDIKVGSTISEVNAVDSLVNPHVGTDGKFTDPFNSYHLLTDGALRIEYAFDDTDGIYRVADIEYVDSFEIPITEDGMDTTMSVKIDPKDYPIS